MFLGYDDLVRLFPKIKGIQDNNMFFHTVASSASLAQPKGLYIPVEESAGELKEALGNGAIAVLWKEGESVPSYTPNHFPIFYTNDLLKGLKDMMELYTEKLNKLETDKTDVTNFLFLNEKSLNENEATYDIAVMSEKLKVIAERFKQERRG